MASAKMRSAIEKMLKAILIEELHTLPDYRLKITELDDESCYVEFWLLNLPPAQIVIDIEEDFKTFKRFENKILKLIRLAVGK